MFQTATAFAAGAAAGAAAILALQHALSRRLRPTTSGFVGANPGFVGANPGFKVEGEERQVYRRFLAVCDRRVVYPDGRIADFDIVGHPRSFHFVAVFVFHSADCSITLLREFAQAALPEAALIFGLVCGGYDPRKHRDVRHAAEAELSEEARLEGGEWTPLLPAGQRSLKKSAALAGSPPHQLGVASVVCRRACLRRRGGAVPHFPPPATRAYSRPNGAATASRPSCASTRAPPPRESTRRRQQSRRNLRACPY